MAKKTNKQVNNSRTVNILVTIMAFFILIGSITYVYNYFKEAKEDKVKDAAELYVLSKEVGYEVKTQSKIIYKGKSNGSKLDVWLVAVKWFYDSGKEDFMTTVVKVAVYRESVDPNAMTDSYYVDFDEITDDMIKQIKIMWEIQ